MPPDYASVYAKLGRAEELLHGIDDEVRAWQDSKPYSFFTKFNLDYTRASLVIKVNSEPQIIRWSLIVADIFHNLRCALDHLVWAIAVHEDPCLISTNDAVLAFPIWDTRPNSNDRRRIERLSDPVRTVVESMQPHARPQTTFPLHPLSILRNIDNANKHKLLKLVVASTAFGNIKGTYLRQEHEHPGEFTLNTGEIKGDTEIVVTTFSAPHPEMVYEYGIALIIAIPHPSATPAGGDRDDYAALCDAIIAEVKLVIESVKNAVI
jgi:hypothetical protein